MRFTLIEGGLFMYKKILIGICVLLCLFVASCNWKKVDHSTDTIHLEKENGEYYDIFIADKKVDRIEYDTWNTYLEPPIFSLNYSESNKAFFVPIPFFTNKFGIQFVTSYYDSQTGYKGKMFYDCMKRYISLNKQSDKLLIEIEHIKYQQSFKILKTDNSQYENGYESSLYPFIETISKTGENTFYTNLFFLNDGIPIGRIKISWKMESNGDILPNRAELLEVFEDD